MRATKEIASLENSPQIDTRAAKLALVNLSDVILAAPQVANR
jgi:hypothetical protein